MPDISFAERFGFPAFVLIAVGVGLYWVLRQVFGKGGLAEVLVNRHMQFLDNVQNFTQQLEEHSRTNLEISHKDHGSLKKDHETLLNIVSSERERTRRVGLALAKLTAHIVGRLNLNGETTALLKAVEDELEEHAK